MISRRAFLGAPVAALAHAQSTPLNVVLILADDLGWADLACYGADLHQTPNLDRLASQSVRFTHAFSASPVCTPTRASIMTGKHPARLGMTIWSEGAATPQRNRMLLPAASNPDLPLAEVTIAERFKERGYVTASIGKWHLGGATRYPETQGFDINTGGTLWGAPPTYFAPYRGTLDAHGEIRYVPGIAGGGAGEYLTTRLTSEAIRVMESAGDRPFFLYLAHHAVHTPIEAPAEIVERYRARIRAGMRHQNAGYAAMVESLDDSVGRVLSELERRRLAGRTVVVFASDNGGYVNPFRGQVVTNNAPLRSGKGSLYEGGIRVPLMIRWPGLSQAGAVCDEPVCSTDLFPTLLGDEASTDGLSLRGLLKDPGGRLNRDELYFHYPHYYPTTTPVSAIRTRDWKLLHYYELDRDELFQVSADESEVRDRILAERARAAVMRGQLEAWLNGVAAKRPRPNPEWKAAVG